MSRIDVTLLGCDVEDHLTEERTENSGDGMRDIEKFTTPVFPYYTAQGVFK